MDGWVDGWCGQMSCLLLMVPYQTHPSAKLYGESTANQPAPFTFLFRLIYRPTGYQTKHRAVSQLVLLLSWTHFNVGKWKKRDQRTQFFLRFFESNWPSVLSILSKAKVDYFRRIRELLRLHESVTREQIQNTWIDQQSTKLLKKRNEWISTRKTQWIKHNSR